jgi:phenylalanyl-tRNA synthetase beta chain
MKIAYSHLVQYISENPSINQISDSLFQLGHEHEIDGDIFEMEFTPNRGDCLSINGLLRDLAVFYTIDLNHDTYNEKLDELLIDFDNLSKDICPKISFLKLEIDEVPEIYKDSLEDYFLDLGLNKNNFFTDVSNFLSYETGQPTHCYDASKISDKLVFQEIDSEKEFETLLDKKINLTKKNAVFSINNEVINLAGVVGGKSTSCSSDTKTVIVECAYFQPEAIIGKSIKYDIQSEASHKFERGVDPKCHDRVLRRFIKLVSEHANIKNMSVVFYKFKDNPIHQIPVNVQKINQIIGINISENEYTSYLSKLGFNINEGFIKVPSFRSDVKTQNDLAEEVARVIGYDNIATSEISIPKNHKTNHKDIENKLRYFLLDHGFYEVINSPFVSLSSKQAIRVDNPLDSNRKYLRTSLKGSMIDSLTYNERRQQDSIKLFEISDVYFSSGQKKRLIAIIASGRIDKNYQDFSNKINNKYLAKIIGEFTDQDKINIETISRDKMNSKINNHISYVEIEISSFNLNILDYQQTYKTPKSYNVYKPISEFPSSSRDLSFSIKDFDACKLLEDTVLSFSHEFIKDIFIFDYYKNEKMEEIKIAFRFIFQSNKGTLKEKEVNDVINTIIKQALSIKTVQIPGLKN